jgi:arginase
MSDRQRRINILSVPSDVGSVYSGKSKAPDALVSAGLLLELEQADYKVTTSSALPQGTGTWQSSTRAPHGARNESAVVDACCSVEKAVEATLQSDFDFRLILSGECLYCLPILSAYWAHHSDKRVGILYMDADCDLYTPEEPDSSGNIAGMTMTHFTHRPGALASMKQFARPDGSPVVDSENIVLFGFNASSPANLRTHMGYLFDNNFRVFTSSGVAEDPVGRAEAALKWLEERVDIILVHLDVDVIDPGEFPLGNVPNWTGLQFDEVMLPLKIFLKSQKAVALSIAEVNPDHDPKLEMCRRLVKEVVDGLRSRP